MPERRLLTGVAQRLGHLRWFAWLGPHVTPLDHWIRRRTRGRWSLVGYRTNPGLLLTTTGRRSGQARVQPLLYARDADAYVVVGSNWGQSAHPAWTANLLSQPEATVDVDGARVPVVAEFVTGVERDRVWRLLTEVWPAYDTYDRRAAGRRLRVFRLTPRPD